MQIILSSQGRIPADRFRMDTVKADFNPYMTGKVIKKRYESMGYKTLAGDNFESSMLVDFIRRYRYIDRYLKVKTGEYKPSAATDMYNKTALSVLGQDNVDRLLFICRVCSYAGDPSFPDMIIYNGKESGLRYAYTGDEMRPPRLLFFFLAKNILKGIGIKFASLDFLDAAGPDMLAADISAALASSINMISSRMGLDVSGDETGVDMSIFKDAAETGLVESGRLESAFSGFIGKASGDSRIKGLLASLEKSGLEGLQKKSRPEQLTIIRNALGINMVEANDVLNVYNIANG